MLYITSSLTVICLESWHSPWREKNTLLSVKMVGGGGCIGIWVGGLSGCFLITHFYLFTRKHKPVVQGLSPNSYIIPNWRFMFSLLLFPEVSATYVQWFISICVGCCWFNCSQKEELGFSFILECILGAWLTDSLCRHFSFIVKHLKKYALVFNTVSRITNVQKSICL